MRQNQKKQENKSPVADCNQSNQTFFLLGVSRLKHVLADAMSDVAEIVAAALKPSSSRSGAILCCFFCYLDCSDSTTMYEKMILDCFGATTPTRNTTDMAWETSLDWPLSKRCAPMSEPDYWTFWMRLALIRQT